MEVPPQLDETPELFKSPVPSNAAMLEDLEVVSEDWTAPTCERPSDAHSCALT